MRHLLTAWQELETDVRDRTVVLFLDYDGTLTTIAPTPSQARLSVAAKKTLKSLAGIEDLRIVVVSGRALE